MNLLAIDDRFSDARVVVLNGATRSTVLIGRQAFKLPTLHHGWRNFLRGLIANSLEREWWRSGLNDGLCPVAFSIPGGWLVVMPRCEPVADIEAVYESVVQRDGYVIPAENKDDSFGWLGGDSGRLVAVDYG